jgi:hypothetical protein
MVWKIVRPHYWILDRKVRNSSRLIVTGMLLLLLWVVHWFYNAVLRDYVALLASEQAIAGVASALPLSLLFLALFALLGMGDVVYQLYLASDLELLMAAPIPYRAIFLVKLIQCSRASLLPALGLALLLVAFGLAQQVAVVYYPLVLLIVLLALLLTTAVVIIAVVLIARFLPARKIRSWTPVAIAFLTLTFVLSQQPIMQWFLAQADTIAFLAEALLQPQQLTLLAAAMGAAALVTTMASYKLFELSYQEGWDRFQAVSTEKKSTAGAGRGGTWSPLPHLRVLPQPVRSFLIKEWLALRRDPIGLVNLVQPLVLMVTLLVLLTPVTRVLGTALSFWFLALFLIMFLSSSAMNTSATVVAGEGDNLMLLRSLPITMRQMLKGKFWATWALLVLLWTILLLLSGWWLHFPLWQTCLLAGIAIWGLTGTTVISVAVEGLKADFSVEVMKRRTPEAAKFLIFSLNMLFVLLTVTTAAWIATRFFADSELVVVLRLLSSFGAVGWLLSESVSVPLTLGAFHVLFWLGGTMLWQAAVRRLEGWEIGGLPASA